MTLTIANFYNAAASLGENHTLRLMPKGDRLATSWQDRLVVAWNDIGRDKESVLQEKRKAWDEFIQAAQSSQINSLHFDVIDAANNNKTGSLKGKDALTLLRTAKEFNPDQFPPEPASKITKWLQSIGDLIRPGKKPEVKAEPGTEASAPDTRSEAAKFVADEDDPIIAEEDDPTIDDDSESSSSEDESEN